MNNMKIVFLDAATMGDVSFEPISAKGELICYESSTPQEALERVGDCDVLIVNKVKVTPELIDAAKNLKLICESATGINNIDVEYAASKGIPVRNAVGYSTTTVVQATFMHILSLVGHAPYFDRCVKSGKYSGSGMFTDMSVNWWELAGKTIGIIGMGNIGSRVAKVAEAFGCRVLAFKRTPDESLNCVSLDTLIRESDVISLHTPLNDGTRGLIGERELDIMKKDAILINVARGAVTDENAVAEAVLSGKIGGFATDVYSVEPFGESHPMQRLINCKNVMLTPHMAWGTLEARIKCLDEIVLNIESFLSGGKRNRVN